MTVNTNKYYNKMKQQIKYKQLNKMKTAEEILIETRDELRPNVKGWGTEVVVTAMKKYAEEYYVKEISELNHKIQIVKKGYNEQVTSIEGLANERDLYSDQAKEMQLQIQECKKFLRLFYNGATYVNLSNAEQAEFSKLNINN